MEIIEEVVAEAIMEDFLNVATFKAMLLISHHWLFSHLWHQALYILKVVLISTIDIHMLLCMQEMLVLILEISLLEVLPTLINPAAATTPLANYNVIADQAWYIDSRATNHITHNVGIFLTCSN